MVDRSSPEEIYAAILSKVDKLILSFSSHSEDDETRRAQVEAQGQLNALRQEIEDSLNQLEKNSEWNIFTLAFYGETNAGKSTLIEILRILLNEPKKMNERNEFSMALEHYIGVQKEIEICRASISLIASEYEGKFASIENQLLTISDNLNQTVCRIKKKHDEIDELAIKIKKEKVSSFGKFLMSLFGKLPEQRKLKEAETTLRETALEKSDCLNQKNRIIQEKENLNHEFEEKTRKLNVVFGELQKKARLCTEQLLANADGKIIGDGRSDFTRTVASYEFEMNNQKFALLDLPGIEGNEGLVLDAINSAIQKAHAVFYVTSQPKPPQTGDKNSEGTLDKIKKHLGQHTEVYAIFNKRVKNPNSLKDPLVDSDETNSLKDLDTIMRANLGEQYRESISVSAYPAFLAVGNCWGENYPPRKDKFLKHFGNSEIILDKSHIRTFSSRLTGDIVNNVKMKIKKSNYKKAAVVLDHASQKTEKIHQKFFEFERKLIETKNSADEQLDNASDNLKGCLDREAHTAINKFKTDIRKKVYDDIDSDIGNSEFKDILKNRTEDRVKELQGVLEMSFKDQVSKFKNDVSDIVNKYQENAAELLNAYAGSDKFDREFKLDIDIKSGINWGGLIISVVSSVVGVLICLTNPAGWVVLALTILGGLISVGKAIFGFFNHDYRKSQQKKSADDNIEKMVNKIYEMIQKNIEESYVSLKSGIKNVKDHLSKTVDHVKERNRILVETKSEFKVMAKTIVQEGDM